MNNYWIGFPPAPPPPPPRDHPGTTKRTTNAIQGPPRGSPVPSSDVKFLKIGPAGSFQWEKSCLFLIVDFGTLVCDFGIGYKGITASPLHKSCRCEILLAGLPKSNTIILGSGWPCLVLVGPAWFCFGSTGAIAKLRLLVS